LATSFESGKFFSLQKNEPTDFHSKMGLMTILDKNQFGVTNFHMKNFNMTNFDMENFDVTNFGMKF
jgi:hypothetical protein